MTLSIILVYWLNAAGHPGCEVWITHKASSITTDLFVVYHVTSHKRCF